MFIPIRYGVELFESPLRSRPTPSRLRSIAASLACKTQLDLAARV